MGAFDTDSSLGEGGLKAVLCSTSKEITSFPGVGERHWHLAEIDLIELDEMPGITGKDSVKLERTRRT